VMAEFDAARLLQLGRDYMECRILLTAAELDLFTLLRTEPLSAAQVADRTKADLRAMTILLDAVAAIGLLSKREGRYRCEPDLARLLSGSRPGSVLPMVLHSAGQWKKWSDLTGIVRGEIEPGHHPRTPHSLRAFIEAMDVAASPRADPLVAAVKPASARRLIDVGGGPGTFTRAFLNAVPAMKATLFDQPDVIEIARERLQAAGVLDRVTLVSGDFEVDELPGGHDLALLSAIIHQNSQEQNVDLYRKVFRALVPGGRIVVRDHVLKPDRTRPRRGAVFAINMLVSTSGGNCYTFDEIRDGLIQAGFERIALLVEDEQMNGLVEAFRPPT
jgi:predicted O-methyltransferase YrrM